MKILFKRWILVALTTLLVSCSPWERANHDYPVRIGANVDHARWTRDARLYGDFETVGMWSMTLLSKPFLADLHALIGQETPGRESAEIVGFPLAQTDAVLLVILSSPDRHWRHLQPPRSPWAINAVISGAVLAPANIRKLRPTAAFERYLPAWNPWSTAWLVSFPAPATALEGVFEVQVSAPGGKTRRALLALTFQLIGVPG